MSKKSISLILLLSVALSCLLLPTVVAQGTDPAAAAADPAAAELDALAAAAGKEFRVGSAEEAYADGAMTGYYVYADFETVTKGGAANGKTLTLIADIDAGDVARNISSACIIDGNGYTITVNRSGILFNIHEDCTVVNLTAVNEGVGGVLQITDGGTLTVRNSTLRNPNPIQWGTVIVQNGALILDTGAKILVEGAVGTDRRSSGVYLQNNKPDNGGTATCEVRQGAEIRTTGNTFTINNNGTSVTTVTVQGGTIVTGRRVWASFHAGYSIRINGGSITSESTSDPMFLVRDEAGDAGSSTVEINGGSFSGSTRLIDAQDYSGLRLSGRILWNNRVLYAAPADGDIAVPAAGLRLPGGGSASRDSAGLRFESRIDLEWLSALDSELVTVSTGTLILPAMLLKEGALSPAAIAREQNLNLTNDGWLNAGTAGADGYVAFCGSMVGLSEQSLTGEIAGATWVTLTIADVGSYTFWSAPTVAVVRDLALAYDDAGADSAQAAVLEWFRGTAG